MSPTRFSRSLVLTLLGAAPLLAQDPAGRQPAAPSAEDTAGIPVQLRWCDLDGDGLEDALALSRQGDLALYLNRGDGHFDEATLAAGLAEYRKVELVLCADFDGDGRTDLYLGSAMGEPELLRNLGNLAFEETVTGIDHQEPELSATALDYDRDGKIDLDVSTQAGEVLYHNTGKARFERVALPLAGLATLPGAPLVAASAQPGAASTVAKDAQQATAGSRTALSAPRTLGTSAAASGGAFDSARASGPGSGTQPLLVGCGFAAAAAAHVVDQATGSNCIEASSVPTMDMLYPMSTHLNVSVAGNVGIGTATPSAKLDVVGAGRFVGSVTAKGGDAGASLLVDSGDTTSAYSELRLSDHGTGRWSLNKRPDNNFGIDQPGINTFFMIQSFTGNVAIGTNPTAYKLDVNGTAHVNSDSHFDGDIVQSTGNQLYFGEPGENGATLAIDREDGAAGEGVINVHIGDTSASRINIRNESGTTRFSFWSDGTAYKPGGGSWAVLSDRRKKHDIRDLEGALERLLELRGKTFRYNDPTELGAAPGVVTGFVAQEVEEVFPEWVHETPDGTKTLEIQGFEALSVEAMRELQEENAALRQRVERLESLEARMGEMQEALQALGKSR